MLYKTFLNIITLQALMHPTHLFKKKLSLPYFGQFSEKLRSVLVVLLGRHFSDVRFNAVLVNKFTAGSFFNYKDKLPMRLKSSLVYKFSCDSVHLSTSA